jgi:pantothenate kinase
MRTPKTQGSEQPKADKKTAASRSADRAELVERAIQSIEEKLKSNEVKATLADFIRLLQMQKELQLDQPREIKITWVETTEEEPGS